MLKYLILFFFFSQQSIASDNYQLLCIGNSGKINIVIEKILNKVRLTYNNLEGRKEFPFYDGVLTTNAMLAMKNAAKDLYPIDTKLVVEWSLDQCNLPTDNQMIIDCNSESEIIFPKNTKIKSKNFYTSLLNEKTPNFTYELFKLRIALEANELRYIATIPFDPNHCQLNNSDSVLEK